MKKQVLAAIALAATFASGASMAQQTYVSVAGGAGNYSNIDCEGAPTCDKSGATFKLAGGYEVADKLSIEVGYISFGKASVAEGTDYLRLKVTGLTVGVNYAMPLSSDWSMNFGMGLARLETKADARIGNAAGSSKDNNVTPHVKFGVAYAVNKSVKIEAAADFARADFEGSKINGQAFTIGARFDF